MKGARVRGNSPMNQSYTSWLGNIGSISTQVGLCLQLLRVLNCTGLWLNLNSNSELIKLDYPGMGTIWDTNCDLEPSLVRDLGTATSTCKRLSKFAATLDNISWKKRSCSALESRPFLCTQSTWKISSN